MMANLKLTQKGLILVAIPLAFELAFILFLAYLLDLDAAENRALEHSRAVISQATEVRRVSFQHALNLLMFAMSKSSNAKRIMEGTHDQFKQSMADFKNLLKDDPKQMEAYADLEAASSVVIGYVNQATAAIENEDSEDGLRSKLDAYQLRRESQQQMVRLNKTIAEITKLEKAKVPTHPKQIREWLKPFLLFGVAGNILLAVIIALRLMRGTVKRIHVLLDNSIRLSQNLPLLPVVSGKDEIAELDVVFHEMASTIAAASRLERAVLDNALDVICVLDQELKFNRVNPACESAWGYLQDDLIGKRLISIVAPDDADQTLAYFNSLKSNEPVTALENHISTRHGAGNVSLWMAQWSEPERLFFCVAHDVTTRHEVERLKQEFVAMISHDLRTPLAAVQATLGLVQTGVYGELEEKGKKRVLSAERNCDRLINLISDLIDFEKMQAGRFELDLAPCETAELVERSIESVQGFAEKQKVTLIQAPCSGMVQADSKRFVQVLVNLLSNAIKFSNEGGAVTIGVKNVDSIEVEFFVVDEGRGIPSSHIDSIFERFTQVRIADATEKRGSGLGLSICKSITEAHGGTIGVTSEEGKGSRFFIRLARID